MISTKKAVAAGAAAPRRERRRAVNLSLDADLVARARGLTPNLSGTVETLLSTFVRDEEARRHEKASQLARTIAWLDGVDERDGLLSDEFPSL